MAKSESLERMPGFNAEASLYKTSVTARGRVDDRPSTARSTASSAIFLASHWECTYNARLGGCQWYNPHTKKWAGSCECGPYIG